MLLTEKVYYNFHGHILGSGYENMSFNMGYIPIPKNASSYMKQIFQKNCDWSQEFNYFTKTKEKYIVALRDPFERWTSGILEYFARNNTVCGYQKFLKMAIKNIVLDEHTTPQINFINTLNTDNIIFFKVNRDLSNNIRHFLVNELSVKNIDDSKFQKNSVNENLKKNKMGNILNQYLQDTPTISYTIKDFYKEDYKLINEVIFYGKN